MPKVLVLVADDSDSAKPLAACVGDGAREVRFTEVDVRAVESLDVWLEIRRTRAARVAGGLPADGALPTGRRHWRPSGTCPAFACCVTPVGASGFSSTG